MWGRKTLLTVSEDLLDDLRSTTIFYSGQDRSLGIAVEVWDGN